MDTLRRSRKRLSMCYRRRPLRKIDAALLSQVPKRWRKVAMIVGLGMEVLEDQHLGIPDLYYAQRVTLLVERGKLPAQGDLSQMRYCEVRQPAK